MTTRYARSGDVHIAYQVTGRGAIDLLLLPDGVIPIEAIEDEPSFDRFVRRLETFARVIRFDRRGMGMSDPMTSIGPPTLEQWMRDAEAVLDAVGSERTALLGIAEGGFVATLLAASRPERVSALALVHATPAFTAEPFRNWGTAASALERLETLVDADWGEVGWAIPLFAPSAAGDERYLRWLERAQRRAMSPAAASAAFDVAYRSDIRDVLPAVRAPTLVVHRVGNAYLSPEHGRYIAAHIPGARLVEVDGIDHVPYLGDPTPILDAVEGFLVGELHSTPTDRVLTTLLFTDIVRSTASLSELGDRRWREILLAHHELVRSTLARYHGREIDTAGDGFLASFDGPARAVRCAAAAVATVRRLGIELRAGVHTGECEVVGEKLAGIAVHLAARILESAGPGEVLVSGTVRDLVAGSGLRFEDRGMRSMKGISEAWRLYVVDLASTRA